MMLATNNGDSSGLMLGATPHQSVTCLPPTTSRRTPTTSSRIGMCRRLVEGLCMVATYPVLL